MYFNIGKYNREGMNAFDNPNSITFIQRGKVVSLVDTDDAGRIMVRIVGVDNDIKDSEAYPAFPMLPKHINIVPKIGDAVFLFGFTSEDRYVDRMYIGPVIPQPQDLQGSDADIEAWGAFSFGLKDLGPAPTQRNKIRGGYPDKNDIALQGKKNTDLILKDDEVLLRAGKFVFKGDKADNSKDEFDKLGFKFNNRTQGYVQIKYNAAITVPEDNNEKGEYGTITNIVSNKINLLTHKGGSPRFNLTNQDNLISDDEMNTIIETAHPLVFGDKLVEVLKLIINAITTHSHKYAGMKAHGEGQSDAAKSIQDMTEYDLEQILTKNIHIN